MIRKRGMTDRQPLTTPTGPVVISRKSLDALVAIRREGLLPKRFGHVAISRVNFEAPAALANTAPGSDADQLPIQAWPWLDVLDDYPDQHLPSRVAGANDLDAATLRLALAHGASLVLIDGPIKEKAKLSFIKSEGVVSILVSAYRAGHLSAVPPMVKALAKLGHADVLPGPEMLDALWTALDALEEG